REEPVVEEGTQDLSGSLSVSTQKTGSKTKKNRKRPGHKRELYTALFERDLADLETRNWKTKLLGKVVGGASDTISERDLEYELDARGLEDYELDAREFDDFELDARDLYDYELDARDFDEFDLYGREFDIDELD
ncbi:hypothetical protein H0H87_000335, partial [Tephrocybe sp. NHM501043]